MKMQGLNRKQIYILFFIFGFIIILLNFIVSYVKMGAEIEKDFLNDSKKTLQFNEAIIENNIDHFVHELQTLANSPFASSLIEKGHLKENRARVERNNLHLMDMAKSHEEMMQIRYINNDGDEIARVDRIHLGTKPKLIARGGLQNKKDRYYFKEISQVPEGEMWYSKIDLNVEHGEIQVPHQPVIRLGMPVFKEGKRYGMVIFNIFMQPLLEQLKGSKSYDLYLTDAQGNLLPNPDPQNNWSADLKKGYTLFDELPKIASQIWKKHFLPIRIKKRSLSKSLISGNRQSII